MGPPRIPTLLSGEVILLAAMGGGSCLGIGGLSNAKVTQVNQKFFVLRVSPRAMLDFIGQCPNLSFEPELEEFGCFIVHISAQGGTSRPMREAQEHKAD